VEAELYTMGCILAISTSRAAMSASLKPEMCMLGLHKVSRFATIEGELIMERITGVAWHLPKAVGHRYRSALTA
jgi:hypothetical protein